MKISHEVPRCLLEESRKFNNFDYALVHLLEKDEEYRNFFLKSKKMGREIYLDNSLHELGTAIGGEILMKWINILEPIHVFVPDVWEDAIKNLSNALLWIYESFPENTTPIAIVQASSYREACKSYEELKTMGYQKIAFSYGAHYYNTLYPHPNKSVGGALGRVLTLIKMLNEGIIKKEDRIHLLGTHFPLEFSLYKGSGLNIESIDTSNPIMASLDNTPYTSMGIIDKPKSNMNNCFETPKEDINLQLLYHNIEVFKNLTK